LAFLGFKHGWGEDGGDGGQEGDGGLELVEHHVQHVVFVVFDDFVGDHGALREVDAFLLRLRDEHRERLGEFSLQLRLALVAHQRELHVLVVAAGLVQTLQRASVLHRGRVDAAAKALVRGQHLQIKYTSPATQYINSCSKLNIKRCYLSHFVTLKCNVGVKI